MWIASFYAGLLALLFIFLSAREINFRQPEIGPGALDSRGVMHRQRALEIFAKYVPLALILMALGEFQHLSRLLLHAIGILLLVGQLALSFAVRQDSETTRGQLLGMALTLIALLIGAISDLAIGVTGLLAVGP